MTDVQKFIAAAGLFALGVTAFFAPYDYVSYNGLARIYGERIERESRVTHAPLWEAPTASDIKSRLYRRDSTELHTEVEDVRLAAGRLGIWWAAIAAVAAVAVVIASPSKPPAKGGRDGH